MQTMRRAMRKHSPRTVDCTSLTCDSNRTDRRAIAAKQLACFVAVFLLCVGESSELFSQSTEKSSVASTARLQPVLSPPTVQMLLPGFEVHELPVELTNINNLRYRDDGLLYALGYNGDIWLLSDRDGDGLEETAMKFFENQGRLRGPIGMAVIPPGHALLAGGANNSQNRSRGLVVASKGKVSAILDLDGDDVAEQERIIAEGWVEIPQNVDAIGVAIHPVDGSIYFGLGVKDYNKAYQLDKDGKSQFDLRTERGTIQRIAPDLSSRQPICTGIRFTIGLGFDEHNELFATEQEGATWLPNGNPFDELLHIQPSRHYGFPPRHPKHLPYVFDEPSLFDYRPQHQSTCGLAFNLPLSPSGPIFGPSSWRGDVFVCGQSRGKLYRTQLIRDTEGEYIATNELIGCLSMLTVDCCLSPKGDLLVACHSGAPDWGSGPSGKGKLFRIRYRESDQGQPVAIWSATPHEVRVEFDKPLAVEALQQLGSHSTITYGTYVAAADRLETIRPGYEVTKLQQSTPRYDLPILSTSVSPDRRTLILSTARHQASVGYGLSLPGLGREFVKSNATAIQQLPAIDLAYSLNGVQAHWKSIDGSVTEWNGWLPHLDLELARKMTQGQQHIVGLWDRLKSPGILTLKTQLDPNGLFYPTVQPGSTLDYPLEEDHFLLDTGFQLTSTQPFESGVSEGILADALPHDGRYQCSIDVPLKSSACVPMVMQLKTGKVVPTISIRWHARFGSDENRSGQVAVHRLLLPWADLSLLDKATPTERSIPELAEANWGRGRQVFLGQLAGCSKCHIAHGIGEKIGPDLSNLIHRDFESVVRDIKYPHFSINPDYITYIVVLKDSRVLTGALRSEGDQFWISDQQANITIFSREDIDELKPSSLSIMPEGIFEKLPERERNDLLAFLLQQPPRMPTDGKEAPPRLRSRQEVESALKPLQEATSTSVPTNNPPEAVRPLNVLLVAGKKDHGPGEHDYPAWLRMWSELMSAAEAVSISTAMEWPTPEQIQAADTIVFFQRGQWDDERANAIDAHIAAGRGLVYVHWAIEGGSDATPFARRIGMASFAKETRYRHGSLDVSFRTGSNHPIARNFEGLDLIDESYWKLHGDPSKIQTIATVVEDGEVQPLFWTLEPSRGRVFVSIPGHYSWTFDDPMYRILLLRGIAWSARENVDRFNELVLLGVEFEK
jgi:putative heme-binding domain-containing protein